MYFIHFHKYFMIRIIETKINVNISDIIKDIDFIITP